MSSTKIFVILLVLVVMVFVVVTIYGSRQNAGGPTAATDFKIEEYSGLEKASQWLPTYGPKLEPEQMKQGGKVFKPGSHPEFHLQVLPITIQISPDPDHKFRKATFTVTPKGCAVMQYKTDADVDTKLKDQTWPTETSGNEKATFWVLKTESTITFRSVGAPCKVALE